MKADQTSMYTKKQQEFKKMIKVAKAASWKEFCTETNGPKDISKVIRSVTKSKMPDIGLIKDKDGVYSNDPSEAFYAFYVKHTFQGV